MKIALFYYHVPLGSATYIYGITDLQMQLSIFCKKKKIKLKIAA